MSLSKVWLITGCTSGFGSEIAKAALAHGDRVIATGRNVTKLEHLKAAGAATLELDVTAGDANVQKVIDEALQIYGTIDILVNNAAYSIAGTVEGTSDEENKAQFETNVFGQLTVIRAVLPHMRSRKAGVIASVGSSVTWKNFAGGGTYGATKCALVGFTESLRLEVAHLGIDVTLIEPGFFRTSLISKRHTTAKNIDDYTPVMDSLMEMLSSSDGKQRGDPAKAAQVIVEALTKSGRCEGRTLPLRLPIGKDTVPRIEAFLEQEKKSLREWANLISSTNFDDVA